MIDISQLIRFQDNGIQCWSRVDLDSGEPIYISIAQSGVLVKKSNLGLFGAKLYDEPNANITAIKTKNLYSQIELWTIPEDIQNPILRVFTQTAINCKNVTEYKLKINAIPSEGE